MLQQTAEKNMHELKKEKTTKIKFLPKQPLKARNKISFNAMVFLFKLTSDFNFFDLFKIFSFA